MNYGPVTAVLCGDLNLLRCFAGQGIAIAMAVPQADDLTFHSRYCQQQIVIGDALREPQQVLENLVAAGKRLPGRPVLFVDNDPMLLLVSRNRQVLQEYYRFLLPDPQSIEDLANKVRFADLAIRLQLPVPMTLRSGDFPSSQEAANRLSLPCIFKPVCHVGAFASLCAAEEGAKPFKALLASNPRQFQQRWQAMSRHTGEFVVQEYIPGADDCLYSFHAYLDGNSRPLGYYVGRKIRTYPKCSGVSTYLELVKDAEVERLGLEIVAKLKLVGAVKLDFKRDVLRQRLYLMEVNPRFNLWNHLGTACGINLPLMAYMDLWGRTGQPMTRYRTGVRWLSLANDLRSFVREYHRDGDLSWGGWLWSLRGEKVHDVFCWRDPRPYAVLVGRWLQSWWDKMTHRRVRQSADRHSAPAHEEAAKARDENTTVPRKYAIIADIHGNLEALEAVMDAIQREGVQRVVCLGDVLGRCADPNRCLQLIRQRTIACVRGNHETAAAGLRKSLEFTPIARRAVAWAARRLTSANLYFLKAMPLIQRVDEHFLIVHAALHPQPNEIVRLTTEAQAAQSFAVWETSYPGQNLCFFGHTHQPTVFEYHRGTVSRLESDLLKLSSDRRYLVNPGSVGQPRDGDWQAAYAIFDADAGEISFRRIPYDHATSQRRQAWAEWRQRPSLLVRSAAWLRRRARRRSTPLCTVKLSGTL